jgi:hypothetical protein
VHYEIAAFGCADQAPDRGLPEPLYVGKSTSVVREAQAEGSMERRTTRVRLETLKPQEEYASFANLLAVARRSPR